MSALYTVRSLEFVLETTPDNASGQSIKGVSTDPTGKTLGPTSGSTPASNSETIILVQYLEANQIIPRDLHPILMNIMIDAVRTQTKHETGYGIKLVLRTCIPEHSQMD